MVSVIKKQLLNEARVNQEVSDYVCTSSSTSSAVHIIRQTLLRKRPYFNEYCSFIYIVDVEKMTSHLVLSRDIKMHLNRVFVERLLLDNLNV